MDEATLARLAEQYGEILGRLERCYAERVQYRFVLRPVLDVGLSQFQLDQSRVRQMADRVLTLLDEARRDRLQATTLASQLKERYDLLLVNELAECPDTPKRLSTAEQRNLWVGQKFVEQKALYERWQFLADTLGVLVRALDEQLRHLLGAKADLQAQLWAVRVHAMFGDLVAEIQQINQGVHPVRKTDQPTQNIFPPLTPTK